MSTYSATLSQQKHDGDLYTVHGRVLDGGLALGNEVEPGNKQVREYVGCNLEGTQHGRRRGSDRRRRSRVSGPREQLTVCRRWRQVCERERTPTHFIELEVVLETMSLINDILMKQIRYQTKKKAVKLQEPSPIPRSLTSPLQLRQSRPVAAHDQLV